MTALKKFIHFQSHVHAEPRKGKQTLQLSLMKINHRMSRTLLMATNFNLCKQIVLYAKLGLSQITFSLCPLVNRNTSYKKALKTNELLTCIILYNLPFIWPVTKKKWKWKIDQTK